MRTTEGRDLEVDIDETGGMVRVTWTCPYCDWDNHDFFFSSEVDSLNSDFAVDRECSYCEKMVTIECEQ